MDESSFYSIDRLVEFGLTLGVATQMDLFLEFYLQEVVL